MGKKLQTAVELLRAAGYTVQSYGGYCDPADEGEVSIAEHDSKLRAGMVPAWLREQGRFPTPEAVRLTRLEQAVYTERSRINRLEDQVAPVVRALCDALAGRTGEPVLCYATAGQAWFTTDLDNQWGDDWNDAPLNCNAGTPYEYSRGSRPLKPEEIPDWYLDTEMRDNLRKHYAGDFKLPTVWGTVWSNQGPYLVVCVDWSGPWEATGSGSVQDVNTLVLDDVPMDPSTVFRVPLKRGVWLTHSTTGAEIHAGTPLAVFRDIVGCDGATAWPRRAAEPRVEPKSNPYL
jgi:hypothetical protein